MDDYLKSMGVDDNNRLAARLAYCVWCAIDWQDGLWKSAGVQVYDRFESRIRQAARESTVVGFLTRLSRRCHVTVPPISPDLVSTLAGCNERAVLGCLRYPALVVAYMRLWIEEKRRIKKEGGVEK